MFKSKFIGCVSLVAAVVIAFSGCGQKQEQQTVPASAVPAVKEETISIVAFGDNLMHMPVINSGRQADGTYDYSFIFRKLQPTIRDADIAVINQETVFGGAEMGYSGYPLFNSPSDMGRTLVNEGFDVVLHATNHTMDKWAKGVENTLEFWKEYPQITVLGINESQEDKNSVRVVAKKGAKIAMLNYTYGTNGIPVPEGKEYLVNYIDEEKIQKDAEYAEANTDFTIAFMHWGVEYATKPSAEQKELAEKMCQWGVDLIVGAHPHVIQPMEWITSENGNKMLVYYSLGNFVSRQKEARNLLGGMADIKLKYDGKTMSIDRYSFVPIVTHYDTSSSGFTVYRLDDYSNDMAVGHGVAQYDGAVSVERWAQMVEDTFEGYDTTPVSGF